MTARIDRSRVPERGRAAHRVSLYTGRLLCDDSLQQSAGRSWQFSGPFLSARCADGNDSVCLSDFFVFGGSITVSNGESVTQWLHGIKAGDSADIQRLWDRYFERLVRLAGAKLPGHCRRSFDEEDVAISAFQSFCDRAGQGQFPQLSGRDDLWRLLATLTVRKALLMMRHQTRQKRGGGRVLGESAFQDRAGAMPTAGGLGAILSKEPTPQDAAHFADVFDHLINKLHDSTLKTIALRKLKGHTAEEISAELGTSTRTIDRKLRLIRALWREAAR
jgi:DNA-directed RNA polymerase specialized sigma24 family protein